MEEKEMTATEFLSVWLDLCESKYPHCKDCPLDGICNGNAVCGIPMEKMIEAIEKERNRMKAQSRETAFMFTLERNYHCYIHKNCSKCFYKEVCKATVSDWKEHGGGDA